MSDDLEPTSRRAEEDAKGARREARAAISATYVDTWAILTWRGHVRFVLGESFSGTENQYRAAFVMEIEEAEHFANHLLELIEKRKQRDAARESGGESDGDAAY